MKCKMFTGGIEYVERTMNEWLSRNLLIKIQSVTQSSSSLGSAVYVTIIYIQPEHKTTGYIDIDRGMNPNSVSERKSLTEKENLLNE